MELFKRQHAVHFGHHVIHQYQVVFLLGAFIQALPAASGGVDFNAGFLEQVCYYEQVYRKVVHREYLRFRSFKAVMIFVLRARGIIQIHSAAWSAVNYLLGKLDRERAAASQDASRGNCSAHKVAKPLDYRQTQPCALDIPVALEVEPLELCE